MPNWEWDAFSWDPWAEMERVRQRMGRLLRGLQSLAPRAGLAPIRLWSGDRKAVVTAQVPGIRAEDLNVSVERSILTISGSRQPLESGSGEHYVRLEREQGAFSRVVTLPFPVDPEKVTATCTNGVLRVVLPRAEAARPSVIEIQS